MHPTETSRLAPNRERSNPVRSRRRRIVVAMTLLALIGSTPVAMSASALPPRCSPQFAPSERCEPPPDDPPPDDPPPPQPATWKINTRTLVQDPNGITLPVTSDRSWAAGSTLDPAGSADLVGGVFTFPDDPQPAGSAMVMRVHEAGSPGSLCRTRPAAQLPSNWSQMHLLVPAPITKGAAELDALVATFGGPQTGLPAGVGLTITDTNLAPRTEGLDLGIQGVLQVGDMAFDLDYSLLLNLDPATGTDLNDVLLVRAPGPGTIGLTWISTPPANGDAVIAYIAAVLEGQLRNRVVAQAGPLVNTNVTTLHDVTWWTDQGFTLSVRDVSYDSTGLTVRPSLCRYSG